MTVSEKGAENVERVYCARTDDELAAAYDAWAEDYDRDLISLGYRIPGVVAGYFGRYVDSAAAPVLDAGAGTGLLGEALAVIGYRDMVGIDLSQGMLGAAARKNVYRDLHWMRLGGPLDFPDDHFAATASGGTFTEGHAKPDSFDELIRITRPGGHMIFSIRVDGGVGEEFLARQDALEREGKWSALEATDAFQSMPVGEGHVLHRVFVYRVS